MKLAAVVFDCDGVILESADLKSEAFFKLGAEFGPEAQKILYDYHLEHTGVSRYTKFAWFYQNVLGREITPEESERLGKIFERYCTAAVQAAPFVPGFEVVLKATWGKMPLFVASGTPKQELLNTLTMRGLAEKFTGIYGTPPDKASLLGQIIASGNFKADEVLMVGDGETDHQAAQVNGTLFYGRGKRFANRGCPWSEDLYGMLEYL